MHSVKKVMLIIQGIQRKYHQMQRIYTATSAHILQVAVYWFLSDKMLLNW